MRRFSFLLLVLFCKVMCAQVWQQIGPTGGYFKDFIFDQSNSNIIYAGSDDGGGLWRSTNSGAAWSLLTKSLPNLTAWKITQDPVSPNTLYVCDMYGRYGIVKSTNAGLTWTVISNGLSSKYDKMATGLVVMGSNTLIASTGENPGSNPPRPGNGVFISTNGGALWMQGGLAGKSVPAINKTQLGTIFAGTYGFGLYYSNDTSKTWTPHFAIPNTAIVREIEVKDSIVVVATSAGVFLSANWGINFTNTGLSGNLNFDIAIHKVTPFKEIFCSTLSGIQKYSTQTSTWTPVSSPVTNNQLMIGIVSNGSEIYCSMFSNSPVIKSSDGGLTWNYVSSSPVATEIGGMYVDPMNNQRILVGLLGSYSGTNNKEGVYETTNGGLTWSRKGPLAHVLCLKANPLNSNSFFLGTFGNGLYKTNNSFSTFSNPVTGNVVVSDVAVAPGDSNIVLATEINFTGPTFSILRSTNAGNSFTPIASLLGSRILFNPINNDTVYLATGSGIYRSIDKGITWNSWVLSAQNIISLGFHNGKLLCGTKSGVLYEILGNIPAIISTPWPQPTEIKNILSANNKLYIGLNGAEQDTSQNLFGSLWLSLNNGITWSNITGDISSTNIYGNAAIFASANTIYVGTYGGGVYTNSTILEVTDWENEDRAGLIYPNPCNNVNEIRVKLNGNNDNISYSIFNLLGQKIFSGAIDENNKIYMNGGVSKGIYIIEFYREDMKVGQSKLILE